MDGKIFMFDLQRFDTTKEMKVITQDSDGSLKVQNATVTLNAQNVVTAVETSGTATALETTTVDGKSVYALDGDYVIDKSTVTLKNSLYVADGKSVSINLYGQEPFALNEWGRIDMSKPQTSYPAILTSDSTVNSSAFYNDSLIVVQQGGSLTVRTNRNATPANANISMRNSGSAISVIGDAESGKATNLTFDSKVCVIGKEYGIKDDAVSGTTINLSSVVSMV